MVYAELVCIFLCVPRARRAVHSLPMSVEPQDGYEHVSTTSKSYVMEISLEDDLPNGAYFEHGDLGFGMGSPAPISAYFPAGSTYADVAQNFFKKYVTEYTAAHLDATQISPTTLQYTTKAKLTIYSHKVTCVLDSVTVKGAPINLEECGAIDAGRITIKIGIHMYRKCLGNETPSGCCVIS